MKRVGCLGDTMARPSKITRELVDKIIGIVRAGNYLETAAAAAGINKPTLRAWLKAGARSKTNDLFAQLAQGVEAATNEAEARHVAMIAKASQAGAWQASAWYLERKFADRWGRQRLEITGRNGAPMQVEVAKVVLFPAEDDSGSADPVAPERGAAD
jgi:hypothetical protein